MDYSFIIPAHNAEKVLERCVTSIEQDIELSAFNCEVIIVENGSEDNTLAVIEQLRNRYGDIISAVSEKGVSKARNKGISLASGKRIVFVDADDIWEDGSLRIISNDNEDVCIYGFTKGNAQIIHDYNEMNTSLYGEEIYSVLAWMMSKPTLRMAVWAKVFSGQLIKDNKLFFNEEMEYSEDSDFVIRCMLNAKSVRISYAPIYRYSLDNESVTRSVKQMSEKYSAALETTKKSIENAPETIKDAFYEYVLNNLNVILVHEVYDSSLKISYGDRIRRTKKIVEMEPFKTAIQKIETKKLFQLYLLPELFFKIKCYNIGGLICSAKDILNRVRG